MFLLQKDCIEDIEPNDMLKIKFAPIPCKDEWKIPIVKKIMDLKTGEMFLPGGGLNPSELDDRLDAMTTE